MRERDEYLPGVPCWVDLSPSDLDAATRFYAELFGWQTAEPTGGPAGYRIARRDGGTVAGIGPLLADLPPAPAWHTYVRVESADATAEAVTAAGGTVMRPSSDMPGLARVAACADPTGAAFRLWEPLGVGGAAQVNEPGTWNFSELSTPDPDAAKAFYGTVFGWEGTTVDFGGEAGYFWRRPGYGDFLERYEPGIRSRQAEEGVPLGFEDAVAWLAPLPAGEAPHWSTTFATDDPDRLAAAAQRLGGGVVVPPFDAAERIRMAVLTDPEGTTFTVSRYG